MNTYPEKMTHAEIRAEGKALMEKADAMLEKLIVRRVRLSQQVKQLTSELEAELARRNPPEPTA